MNLCGLLGVIFGTLFTLGGIGLLVFSQIFPNAINTLFKSGLDSALSIDVSSDAKIKDFSKEGNASQVTYWISNITNIDAVMSTSMTPIVNSMGPYVFDTYTTKYDVKKIKDKDEVEYRTFTRYKYNKDKSCGTGSSCVDLKDNVTIVNAAYISLMAKVKDLLGGDDSLFTGLFNGLLYDEFFKTNTTTSLGKASNAVYYPLILLTIDAYTALPNFYADWRSGTTTPAAGSLFPKVAQSWLQGTQMNAATVRALTVAAGENSYYTATGNIFDDDGSDTKAKQFWNETNPGSLNYQKSTKFMADLLKYADFNAKAAAAADPVAFATDSTKNTNLTSLKGPMRYWALGTLRLVLEQMVGYTINGTALNSLGLTLTALGNAAVADFGTSGHTITGGEAMAVSTWLALSYANRANNTGVKTFLSTFAVTNATANQYCTFGDATQRDLDLDQGTLEDVAVMQFACGQVVGALSGLGGKQGFSAMSPALQGQTLEFFSTIGNNISFPQARTLMNFMLNGTITSTVYDSMGAAGATLKEVIGKTEALLPGSMGRAIGRVLFVVNSAKVCAGALAASPTTADTVCALITADYGGLTAANAIAWATHLTDGTGNNFMTMIEGGNGGPFITKTAEEILVNGYVDPTITYLRPYLPASLGIPDSPAGPHAIQGDRLKANESIILESDGVQAALDAEKKRLDEQRCDKTNATSDLKYGGKEGFVQIETTPAKSGYLVKVDGSEYASRGECNGSQWVQTDYFNMTVPVGNLSSGTKGVSTRDIVLKEWYTGKAKDFGLPEEEYIFVSSLGRAAKLSFDKNELISTLQVRKFNFVKIEDQTNRSSYDKALKDDKVTCLYDISRSSDKKLDIYFGRAHLADCKIGLDESTIHRGALYSADSILLDFPLDFAIEPITGLYVRGKVAFGPYHTVDPLMYSTYHPGLCAYSKAAGTWPVRTTSCQQTKKTIIPSWFLQTNTQIADDAADTLAILYTAYKIVSGLPSILLYAGIGLLVVGILFLACGIKMCQSGGAKVGA